MSNKINIRKNYFYNSISYLLTIIFPLITIPFVAKILGPDRLGLYLYTYSIVAIFGLVSNLGIINYGNKAVAASKDDRSQLSITFTSLYIVSFAVTIPALVMYIAYCIFFVQQNQNIFLLQGIFLLSTLFDISWFFMGMEEFKLTIKRDVLLKCITLLLILLFVRKENGLVVYTLIMATGALVSQLALWPFIGKYTKLVRVKAKNCIVHLQPLFALFIPVVAVSIYTTVNKVILGNMTNMSQVGQFDTAIKIMSIPLGLITAMGIVMLPRMSNIIAKKDNVQMNRYIRKSMSFAMFMSLPIVFGLIAVAGTLVPLFLGADYVQTGTILAIVAPVVAFAAWANVLRTQYLIPQGRNKSYIISVLIGAVISIALNIILIPKMQSIGAAIAMLTAEFSVMAYQTYALRHDLHMREYAQASRTFLIKALIMFVTVIAVGIVVRNPYIRLALQVIVGGGIYGLLNIGYLDQTILNGKLKHPAWNKLLIAKEKLYMQGDDISGDH